MLKWILATLVSVAAHAEALHTGELLYQKKGDSRSHVLKAKSNKALEIMRQEMLRSGEYEFVSYNTLETTPPDGPVHRGGEINSQWHHINIETEAAWAVANSRKQIIVAVCDSGVQADHEDLRGQLLPGHDLVNNETNNSTTTSHGTFVGGLIAAEANTIGVVGVAPFIKILPIRISNSNGATSMKLITDCIRYAADRKAKVINVSFTGVESSAVAAAGTYAANKGALLVYAAGNAGYYRSLTTYPNYKNVFAVGATNPLDERWKWEDEEGDTGGSNYGPFIDLMAPGETLYSTTKYDAENPLDKYRTGSGTSYAAPIVSAVAALIYSVNPNFKPAEVQQILQRSADPMNQNGPYYGAGRVNAHKAVQLAAQRSRHL